MAFGRLVWHSHTPTPNNDLFYEVPTDAMVTFLSWAKKKKKQAVACQKNAWQLFFY